MSIEENKRTLRPLGPDPVFRRIRLLCCDVDGVLTDGGLYFDRNGIAMLRFHVRDGHGLKSVMAAGIEICFISQSRNEIISARATALGVRHCYTGVDDKLEPVLELARRGGYGLDSVCHIADDLNDLTLLRAVGVAVTVPSSCLEVRQHCHFMTSADGGRGAVRELCDAILVSWDL
ncbi:MAG: hypothetical protein KDK08_06790 [Rhizobiaceae bacterium]|nr:hypothetical protein [Rhizobiaceae bacterium]